ncbi:AraC family transcriptional regulator, partial [Vibrio parahaemolyticus]|nr:AraC family transcriptional regulator [Vibrio parahaemolyticus]
ALLAQLCGYQSEGRFSQRFKGKFGLTPSEYIKTVAS